MIFDEDKCVKKERKTREINTSTEEERRKKIAINCSR